MTVSDELLWAIERFEGCKLTSYKCPAGVWTIGMGHTRGVKQGQKISREQAVTLLRGDLLPIASYLNGLKRDWTQGQFDACCDFCFNLGIGAFNGSTLKKYILMKKPASEIQAQFRKWVYAGGKKLPGLVTRREWEAQQWLK